MIEFRAITKINYNYMSKKLIPVLTLATVSSIAYFLKKYLSDDNNMIQRSKLIDIIITLRKYIFGTLREIAYATNCLKIIESGIQPRKVKDIIMKDGASAQKKLDAIQNLVLQEFQVTRQKFQQSCKYHSYNDIEIKMLLQSFQNDIQNALDGTVEFYHGPLPNITGSDAIRIYREITLRRMKIIQEKIINNLDNSECIKLQFQIQQYLQSQNITHIKQSSQKIFISLLEHHYKTDSQFKLEFESLQKQFQDFIDEVKKKKEKKE